MWKSLSPLNTKTVCPTLGGNSCHQELTINESLTCLWRNFSLFFFAERYSLITIGGCLFEVILIGFNLLLYYFIKILSLSQVDLLVGFRSLSYCRTQNVLNFKLRNWLLDFLLYNFVVDSIIQGPINYGKSCRSGKAVQDNHHRDSACDVLYLKWCGRIYAGCKQTHYSWKVPCLSHYSTE